MSIFSMSGNLFSTVISQQPPTVNPKFKDYHCFAIVDAPWARGYDINQDGWFGVDDLKARISGLKDLLPIDESLESLNEICRKNRMGDIPEKVSWHLREVVDEFKAEKLQTREAIARVDQIKNNALQELESYREEFKDHVMMGTSNCEVLDLVAQAKEVLNGEQKGHFGVGILMNSVDVLFQKGYSILDIYPKGPALGKLRRNDVITAIDGKKIGSAKLPVGRDPATGLAYDDSNSRYNSTIIFTVMREEGNESKMFNVTLPQTIWAAQPTNCEERAADWDGTEKDLNGEPVKPEPTSSGCSASPTTPIGCGFWGSLWNAGGNLGEWIYTVTH